MLHIFCFDNRWYNSRSDHIDQKRSTSLPIAWPCMSITRILFFAQKHIYSDNIQIICFPPVLFITRTSDTSRIPRSIERWFSRSNKLLIRHGLRRNFDISTGSKISISYRVNKNYIIGKSVKNWARITNFFRRVLSSSQQKFFKIDFPAKTARFYRFLYLSSSTIYFLHSDWGACVQNDMFICDVYSW